MKKMNFNILTIITMLILLIVPITVKGAENEIEWTDFSNAKFEIVPQKLSDKGETYDYSIKVSNAIVRNDRRYCVIFHAKDEEKTKTQILFNADAVFNNGETTTPITILFKNILEKKDDIYFSVLEVADEQTNVGTTPSQIVVQNQKIDRPKLLPTLGNRVNIYFSKNDTSTFAWFPHDSKLARKINIKIGKITNLQLVRDIRDKKTGALENLLAYAKKITKYNYTGTIVYDIYKTAGITKSLTSQMNLTDKAYYFAYIQLDDEDIYYPVEDIALYQASGTLDLKHYTNNKMTWDGLDELTNDNNVNQVNNDQNVINSNANTTDTTVAKGKIPQTGEAMGYAFITILFIIAASIGYIKFKQYKDIK